MTRLNIVIFDGSFKTTSFINRLASGLAKKHNVYILGFNETLVNKLPHVNYVPLGSNQNYLRFIKTSLSYNFSLKTIYHLLSKNRKDAQYQNLEKALLKIKPDIIHLQWLSNIKLFEPFLYRNQYNIILSQRGYHLNVRASVDQDYYDYLKEWFPKFSGFHSVSKAIKVRSELIYKSKTKIDEVIYSGLDIHNFRIASTIKKKKRIELLSVGRPHWIKGYDDMIKACALLKEAGVLFHYKIIGAANNEELIYLLDTYNLKADITLEEPVSQEEVFSSMLDADLLVLSSIEEGIANVVIEAMALGLIVLSTDCGGMAELVEHEKTGFLVTKRNPLALFEGVKMFSKFNEEQLNTIRENAYKKVEQQHCSINMINQFEALYSKCLNRN